MRAVRSAMPYKNVWQVNVRAHRLKGTQCICKVLVVVSSCLCAIVATSRSPAQTALGAAAHVHVGARHGNEGQTRGAREMQTELASS